MRVPISYALTYPERAATPLPPLDLTSLTLEFSRARHGHVPDALARARRRARGRQRAVRLQRRERGRGRRVPRRAAAVPRRSRRSWGRRSRRSTRLRCATSTSSRGRRRGAGGRGRSAGGGMTWVVASAGSSSSSSSTSSGTSRSRCAVEDAAAELLRRLPARAREGPAPRHRVRHRDDPARRLRPHPRDAPAGGARLRDVHGAGAARGRLPRAGGRVRCGARSSARTTTAPARPIPSSSRRSRARSSLPARGGRRERALRERRGGHRAGRLLARRRRGSASSTIAAGPLANILVAFLILLAVYLTAGPTNLPSREVAAGRAREPRPPPRGCAREIASSPSTGMRRRASTRSRG